ncbi:MAG TPA: 2TM domain-containing protein [Acidimicrobiales bacterium]|nr:2TM domain-containing protein [Acidimicrobiales bacterium]
MTYAANHESDEWRQARKRVTERRDFGAHVVTYVVVNAFLVVVWSITGHGYFWPVWIIAGWGMGLVLHAWDVFLRRPVTDADIEAELHRHRD